MTRRTPEGGPLGAPRIPDLRLEQLALGELPAAEAEALRARLATDPEAAARLAGLEAANREALAAYPPGPQVAAIRRKAEAGWRRSRRRRLVYAGVPVAVAVAAAAVLLVTVGPFAPGGDGGGSGRSGLAPGRGPGPGADLVRIKGGGTRLVILREGEATPLGAGAAVRPGDRLQVHYVATGRARHGVILSLDGRGEVTRHFPATVGGPTDLLRPGLQALPGSFELDDAPGFERFFLVVSARPLDVAAVERAIRALGPAGRARPALPRGSVLQMDLTLPKPSLGK